MMFNEVFSLFQGKSVVIDDENWGHAKRDSYISLIRRKVNICFLFPNMLTMKFINIPFHENTPKLYLF